MQNVLRRWTAAADWHPRRRRPALRGIVLYLRSIRGRNGRRYVLRESYEHDGSWKCRDLFDLGEDPSAFIEYPGGNGFYYKPELEEALLQSGVSFSTDDLDDLFMPFLRPEIRRIFECFRRSAPSPSPWKSISDDELLRLQQKLHPFDKRRLHYLRAGRIDIGELEGRAWKFLNTLLGKSRDEIEHTLDEMERILRPHEIRPYLFTALHLQAYFPGHLLRNHPAGLDSEKLDGYFLDELCYLNDDARFFAGVRSRERGTLHPFLTKYVTLYFDNEFYAEGWDERIREFVGRQARKPRVEVRPVMPPDEALLVLGISSEDFQGMTRKQVIRIYRQKAKRLHPDKGGDHEAFVRLTNAYEYLIAKK